MGATKRKAGFGESFLKAAGDVPKWTDHARWRGDCYRAAALYFIAHSSDPRGLVLCHGFPRLRDETSEHFGKRYGHAWIETADGETVIDITIPASTRGLPRSLFYLLGSLGSLALRDGTVSLEEQPEASIRRYSTQAEVSRGMLRAGHYGPWHDGPEGAL